MRLMEYERTSWFHCLFSNLQGTSIFARKNDIICLQETLGKNEFLQAIQVQHTQFRMFRTFVLDNVNPGGSTIFIHKNILPDHATVSHEITCQGRDHMVTMRSDEGVLVVVSVHFEPDLVSRDLRE